MCSSMSPLYTTTKCVGAEHPSTTAFIKRTKCSLIKTAVSEAVQLTNGLSLIPLQKHHNKTVASRSNRRHCHHIQTVMFKLIDDCFLIGDRSSRRVLCIGVMCMFGCLLKKVCIGRQEVSGFYPCATATKMQKVNSFCVFSLLTEHPALTVWHLQNCRCKWRKLVESWQLEADCWWVVDHSTSPSPQASNIHTHTHTHAAPATGLVTPSQLCMKHSQKLTDSLPIKSSEHNKVSALVWSIISHTAGTINSTLVQNFNLIIFELRKLVRRAMKSSPPLALRWERVNCYSGTDVL